MHAEWIEATVAAPAQPTIVAFHRGRPDDHQTARWFARQLAASTGARVLNVRCDNVSDAVTAYAWLLGEGLDVEKTSVVSARGDRTLIAAVRRSAKQLGLRRPAELHSWSAGSHSCRDGNSLPVLQNRTLTEGLT